MIATTVTLSTKGQLALPKNFREADDLLASDVFRLERVGPGRYILEKLVPAKLPKAKLVRSHDGFLVYRVPKSAPRITDETVKKLEAETV